MKGFALPVVVFLIALGGALAGGGAFVARNQATGQRAIGRSAGIDGLAEEWIARSIAEWDSSAAGAVGVSVALPDVPGRAGRLRRWRTRIDSSVYWFVVEVESLDKPLLRRRLGATVIHSGNGLLLAPGWGGDGWSFRDVVTGVTRGQAGVTPFPVGRVSDA
jgi:hypothetical protein